MIGGNKLIAEGLGRAYNRVTKLILLSLGCVGWLAPPMCARSMRSSDRGAALLLIGFFNP
jgi:hypothetical protein